MTDSPSTLNAPVEPETQKKYRFLIVQSFRLPDDSPYKTRDTSGPKEQSLMNYENLKGLLADVDWDLHPGAISTFNWPVETREEVMYASAARLPIVREACESGKYNAIVLLGGAEPGFQESREIAHEYRIPIASMAFSQMHVASMLGNKFSVIDLTENHNMYYYNLVMQHRMVDRCASIRMINFPRARPGHPEDRPFHLERPKALRGERSEALEEAVAAAIEAIEEDGAEVITFGGSTTFWMQPFLQRRLDELGWDVPVLEGYSCAITLAKMMVDLGVDVSGLMYPGPRPKQWRRKKIF